MDIVKFDDFINEEVQISTFDLVISKTGELGFNSSGIPIKGYLDDINGKIIGSDSKEYVAAIDRSGNLFSYQEVDWDGNILVDGKKLRVPKNQEPNSEYSHRYPKTVRKFWNNREDYTNILPILPTGWVNVKIDMEVIKKVRRYSAGISKKKGISGLIERLKVLSRTKIENRQRSTETIQREMSAIMMLHHLNEIRGHFDPSSAGFLFESYIAGLISGSRVKEDNSKIDLVDSGGNKYQVKLLKFSEQSTPIATETIEEGKKESYLYLDYYIIGYKFADKIRVFILNNDWSKGNRSYVGNFTTSGSYYNFSFAKFRDHEDDDFIFDIPLLNIEEKINNISVGLKDSLEKLYDDLSKFQFNVETILTGVDEGGKLISVNKFDLLVNNSKSHLQSMKDELENLISIVRT